MMNKYLFIIALSKHSRAAFLFVLSPIYYCSFTANSMEYMFYVDSLLISVAPRPPYIGP